MPPAIINIKRCYMSQVKSQANIPLFDRYSKFKLYYESFTAITRSSFTL